MNIQTTIEKKDNRKVVWQKTVTWVFILMVISLGFMQPSMRIIIIRVQISEIIFLSLFALFAAGLTLKYIKPVWDKAYYFFAIYFAALTISAIFSVSTGFSLLKLSGEAFLIGLAVMAHQIIRSQQMLKDTVIAWVAAGTFVGFIGAITVLLFYLDRSSPWHTIFLHHYGSLPPGNYPRVQSTFIYPALLCSYLSVSVMLLLAANKLKWIGKKFFYTSLLLHVTTIMFTVTPGIGGVVYGLLAWVAVWAADNGQKSLRKILIGTGVLTAAASILVSAITFRQVPTSPFTFELFGLRADPTQRFLTWQGALETFLANPIFGNGLGLGVCKVIFLAPSGQMQMLTDAHNIWLNIAGQAGILGLVGFAALTIYLMHRVRQCMADAAAPIPVICSALYIAFISAVLIQGITGSYENARHIWLMFGMIVSLRNLSMIKAAGQNQ